ncbi:MAG: hypothetical protein WCT18_03905 [Patescibacteria group bacterium]
MKQSWQKNILKFCPLIIVFFVALLFANNLPITQDWSDLQKILIAGACGLLTTIVFIFIKKKIQQKKSPETKIPTRTKINDGLSIFSLFVPMLAVIFGLIFLVPLALRHAREIGEQPTTNYSFGLTYGKERYSPDLSKTEYLDKGKIYTIFEVNAGQKWEWYFNYPIEYRILGENEQNPSFQPVLHDDSYDHSEIAPIRGKLQVKSKADNNRLEYSRLIRTQ